MSNKSNKSGKVPRRRFPEFREAAPWSIKQLKQVCALNPATSELPEIFAYIDLESVEAGELKAKKIINREESPSRAQRLLNYGDVIFQIVRPYQRNNFYFRIHDDIKYVASTGYAQLRAFESKDFLFQAIHTDDFVEKVIAKCTGSSYPAINSSDLAEISVAIPKPVEQQKIADCLSSLDELIAAQAQKLTALKVHKKGLMQQLFPAEGETVPKLRFPEFRHAEEWKEKRLGEVLIFQAGFPFDSASFTEDCDGLRLIRNRDLKSDEKVIFYSNSFDEKFVVNDGDVLVGMDGDFTPCVWNKGKALLNQRVGRILANSYSSQRFLFYFLTVHLRAIEEATARTTVKHLSHSDVERIHEPLPALPEQQKIADCLSSIDELIAAQSQKLTALKDHKKGLMQQLFPVLDETPA